jgi:hypothetical protein
MELRDKSIFESSIHSQSSLHTSLPTLIEKYSARENIEARKSLLFTSRFFHLEAQRWKMIYRYVCFYAFRLRFLRAMKKFFFCFHAFEVFFSEF